MTDTDEPDPTTEPEAPAPDAVPRRSRWSRLDRTNRIATVVVGGVSAVILSAAIFGAGVLVGSEFGDGEGHHHAESGHSEHRDGAEASGDEDGPDGGEQVDSGADERQPAPRP